MYTKKYVVARTSHERQAGRALGRPMHWLLHPRKEKSPWFICYIYIHHYFSIWTKYCHFLGFDSPAVPSSLILPRKDACLQRENKSGIIRKGQKATSSHLTTPYVVRERDIDVYTQQPHSRGCCWRPRLCAYIGPASSLSHKCAVREKSQLENVRKS